MKLLHILLILVKLSIQIEIAAKVIKRRLRFSSITMEEFGKATNSEDITLATRQRSATSLCSQLLCADVKAGQWRKLIEKHSLKILCCRRAPWIAWTTRKINKKVLLIGSKLSKSQEAGFFWKHNNAGKNRKQPENRKTKYEMHWIYRRYHRPESIGGYHGWGGQEFVASLIYRVTRSPRQLSEGIDTVYTRDYSFS